MSGRRKPRGDQPGSAKRPLSPAEWRARYSDEPVNPLTAQELHDEWFVRQTWRRTPAQARQDKALLEKLLRRNEPPFSPEAPPLSVPFALRDMWADRIRRIIERGWTHTKASYLRAMFAPSTPEFPLDQSERNEIPPELPGRVPRSLREMLRLSEPSTSEPEKPPRRIRK